MIPPAGPRVPGAGLICRDGLRSALIHGVETSQEARRFVITLSKYSAAAQCQQLCSRTVEHIVRVQKHIDKDPKGAQAWALRGKIYFEQHDFARAEPDLVKAIELDPKNIRARNSAMEFCRQAPGFLGGGMDKAYEQATEIKKLDPVRGLDERCVEDPSGHAVADQGDPHRGHDRYLVVLPRRATASMVTAASRTRAVTTYLAAAL